MTSQPVILQGTVSPEGGLSVDEKIPLPAGPVQITIQSVPEFDTVRKNWWQQLQDARAILEARGTGFRSQQEIEAERAAFRADERIL